jgi:hypothetical protein
MTYRGHIENGAIVLDDPVSLAEGASVRIEVLQEDPSGSLHPDILRFTGVLPSGIDARAAYAEAAATA